MEGTNLSDSAHIRRLLRQWINHESIIKTHRIASPIASAESFSFMASSITFLALPLEPFFFFFFLLLLSEEAPPRSLSDTNGSEGDSFRNVVVIVDVLVVWIAFANVENDEQRITNDKSVLIVQDCDIVVGSGSR